MFASTFRTLGFAFVALGCLSGGAASAQESHQQAEIDQLKERVTQQARQIAVLKHEVNLLLGKQNPNARLSAPALSVMPKEPHNPSPSGLLKPPAAKPALRATPPADRTAARPSVARELGLGGVEVGGDVYLYQYVPFGVPGAIPKFELYALSLQLQARRGPWSFYSDYRFRTTKLRSYYPGNTWLQQAYVGYQTPIGQIRAGSFYRRVGLSWDGSFFGNIQYFDGLKLDPGFGLGFEGSHTLAGRLGAEYSVQYFTSDASVNGSLPGRDFVSEPGAHAKNDVTLRFAPVLHFSGNLSLTFGGSYARGSIDRTNGPHNIRSQLAGDATLQWRGLLTYAEVLNQYVAGLVIEAPQDATYTLFGVRWARGRFQPRVNFSAANYHGFQPRREYIFQPGITVNLSDGFSFLYEFDYWRRTSIPKPFLLDKSLNLVLLYHF
jgi:hypothetical protein